MKNRIEVLLGDITTLCVDAIVNAANESLLGGGGVDGAIHRMAGPELFKQCRTIGGCPTGQARITDGFRLPARYVIHTVGPVYRDGGHGEPDLLRSCYRTSLDLAVECELDTVAFSAISTGVYGYPLKLATTIAVDETVAFLGEHEFPRRVVFCCFSNKAKQVYEEILALVHRPVTIPVTSPSTTAPSKTTAS